MVYPDRLMTWLYPNCLGYNVFELRFKHTPSLFEEGCYTLYKVHWVNLPIKIMIERWDEIHIYDEIMKQLKEGELKVGSEIEVMEVLDKADGKVKYYGKLPNEDSWILPLKAIPKNIR